MTSSEQTLEELYIFLVFEGAVHCWSRFGRVLSFGRVVDTKTAKWSCRCCGGKTSCVDKAVSKWYLYQEDRHLIGDMTAGSELDLDTGDETEESIDAIAGQK